MWRRRTCMHSLFIFSGVLVSIVGVSLQADRLERMEDLFGTGRVWDVVTQSTSPVVAFGGAATLVGGFLLIIGVCGLFANSQIPK
ncbi:MAG: hypothetical protein DWQ45_19845 [Planctomycetota bacterium]|nr:MAG: hypothetical protein DWQ45_19845 [Planctomycetota bacterium]